MENIETLLQRFVDDRDQLSDDELDALLVAATDDASLAARLKDQLVIDELLAQRLAVDRRNFVAQVAQRIRDEQFSSDDAGIDSPTDAGIAEEMRHLLDVELAKQQHKAQRRSSSRWHYAAASLLVIVLAVAGYWWWSSSQQPLASVEEVAGAPTLIRGNQSRPLGPGESLRDGDELSTLPDETMTLRYRDGSELQLAGDTTVRLLAATRGEGKRVDMSWGAVVAEVVPQPAGRPMEFATPVSIATVRGTRLRISGDEQRTRLDVLEGVVDLRRRTDGEATPVRAREFAVATEDELSVQPLTWPVDRRDAVVLLETVDSTSETRGTVIDIMEPLELRAAGHARLNNNFALILTGGSFGLQNASAAVLDSCRRTGEISIEATITPKYVKQAQPTWIVACASNEREINFVLGQKVDRLFLRLHTAGDSPSDADEGIELCRLAAGEPQHVVIAYRAGELVCYLNGRRVYQDGRWQGDLSAWERYQVRLGDSPRARRDWAGVIEGLAIYDRFLPGDEVLRNAELYRTMMARRREIPRVELEATLMETSPLPAPDQIAPAKSALVVSRWRVDGVFRGESDEEEVLVAQWAVLGGQSQAIATEEIGTQKRMTLERFGLNAQLEGELKIDQFSEVDDPAKPRYFNVSDP